MPPCVTVLQAVPPCGVSAAPFSELQPQQASSQHRRQEGSSWHSVLLKLRDAPAVTFGTPQALSEYQAFVGSCIQQAASLAACDSGWSDCLDHLLGPLSRALQLVQAGKTSSGRALAVELLGYAQLAQQVAVQLRGGGNASTDTIAGDSNQPTLSSSTSASSTSTSTTTTTTTSSGSGGAGQFKVPALPLKRQRSPSSSEEQQLDDAVVLTTLQQQPGTPPLAEPQPPQHHHQHEQQQQRRHPAPKRRATPQVWSGGPICMTPAAPPNSDMHGETCCDEALLACWCPISANRLDTEPGTTGAQQQQQQPADHDAQQGKQPVAAAPRASSTSTRSSSHMQQASATALQPEAPPPAPLLSRSAVSAARSDAIALLKRSMHDDPASKPAADVLLFNKAKQLPIVNWSGPIKHKEGGRVVEMCSLALQVPEAFLEEFPGALYAADIRHRKSVSLGRHVVCRASLQPLSEHQLASLAAMARSQLVALCALQTAELHLVPYFDNKNHVRCVGFLKVKC